MHVHQKHPLHFLYGTKYHSIPSDSFFENPSPTFALIDEQTNRWTDSQQALQQYPNTKGFTTNAYLILNLDQG